MACRIGPEYITAVRCIWSQSPKGVPPKVIEGLWSWRVEDGIAGDGVVGDGTILISQEYWLPGEGDAS